MTLSGNYLGLVFFVFDLPYYYSVKLFFSRPNKSEKMKICERICISLMNQKILEIGLF